MTSNTDRAGRHEYRVTVVVDPIAEHTVSYMGGDEPGTGKLVIRPDADPYDIGLILAVRGSSRTTAPGPR